MYCVIFKSKLKNPDDTDYGVMADKMLALAEKQEGFISFEHFFDGPDGLRVSIVHFETLAAIKAWKEHPEHLLAQQQGKDDWYENYQVEVCEVLRSYQGP